MAETRLELPVVVTNSEQRAWKRCRRQWWLEWVIMYRVAFESPRGPASVGRKVHAALEVYYSEGETAEARAAALAHIDALNAIDLEIASDRWTPKSKEHKETETGIKLSRIMVEGYFEWLDEEGEDEYLEIVAAEQERRVKLGALPSGREVHAVDKLDARVLDHRHPTPARRFIDHKTVQNFSDRLKIMRQDEQMLLYHLVEYMILLEEGFAAERTDGAIYNMLRRVQRTAKAKPPFYKRAEVHHGLEELRTFWTRIMAIVEDMEFARARLLEGWDHQAIAYPNPTKDCSWDCDYYTICPLFDDGSDPWHLLETEFVKKHPMEGRYTTLWVEEEKV